MYFLLIYDRAAGKLLESKQFDYHQRAAALEERFELELQYATDPNIEVIVLGADSLEDLARTHGRYFKTVGELAAEELKRQLPHS